MATTSSARRLLLELHSGASRKSGIHRQYLPFVLLYDCETWIMTKDMNAKLNSFATSYYRTMLNTIGLEKVSDTDTILML